MGTCDPKTGKGDKGYLSKDDTHFFTRRFKEFFAPKYGKAAIARLLFHDDYLEVLIQPSAGTSDVLFSRYEDAIKQAISEAFGEASQNIEISSVSGSNSREFKLDIHGVDLLSDSGALKKLTKAFESLRDTKVGEGLVIGQGVFDSIEDRQHGIGHGGAAR